MNTIKYLNFYDLPEINLFISKEKNEFSEFVNLGWKNNSIESHFNKNNNFSIGYFYKNKICAILIGEKIDNNLNYDLDVHIMLVAKDKRRNNIGSDMINFIENNKKHTNISKIYLEVSENNSKAIKFYQKNNFVFFKIRHNYYKGNIKKINAICYFKKI